MHLASFRYEWGISRPQQSATQPRNRVLYRVPNARHRRPAASFSVPIHSISGLWALPRHFHRATGMLMATMCLVRVLDSYKPYPLYDNHPCLAYWCLPIFSPPMHTSTHSDGAQTLTMLPHMIQVMVSTLLKLTERFHTMKTLHPTS